jgi:hypothetical protein
MGAAGGGVDGAVGAAGGSGVVLLGIGATGAAVSGEGIELTDTDFGAVDRGGLSGRPTGSTKTDGDPVGSVTGVDEAQPIPQWKALSNSSIHCDV